MVEYRPELSVQDVWLQKHGMLSNTMPCKNPTHQLKIYGRKRKRNVHMLRIRSRLHNNPLHHIWIDRTLRPERTKILGGEWE